MFIFSLTVTFKNWMGKIVDENEFFSENSINQYEEFKRFKAEEYYVDENKKMPLEEKVSNEFYDLSKKSDNKKTNDNKEAINQQIENNKNLIQKQVKISEGITNIIQTSVKVVYSSVVVVAASITFESVPDVFIPKTSIQESVSISQTESIFESDSEESSSGDFLIEISNVEETTTLNNIQISGTIENANPDYRYVATIKQYNQDNGLIITNEDIPLDIIEDRIEFSVDAEYGIKQYFYSIGYYENDIYNEIISNTSEYTSSQEYLAEYEKVLPKDANITYYDDGSYNVHINTNFETQYPLNFQYGINIIDKEGNVYGNYEGVEKEIDIKVTGLEQMYFEYYDIGIFANKNHVYQRHNISEFTNIVSPTVQLLDKTKFNGQFFEIEYECDSIYDYALSNIELTITDASNNTYQVQIDKVSTSGQIILDMFDKEPGNISIEGIYYYKDNQSENVIRQKTIAQQEYQLNYEFEVAKVRANTYEDEYEGSSCIPTSFTFNYLMPSDYKLLLVDENNNLNKIIPITDNVTLNKEIPVTGANITISILDSNDVVWKELAPISISKEAQNNFTWPTISLVNPNDSLVTYNVDGTINLYRNMNFENNDENYYYDASLFIVDDNGEIIDQGVIHDYRNEKYSIHENLSTDNYYCFKYYIYYKYNGVDYCVYSDVPSGGIGAPNASITASGAYDANTDTTEIDLNINLSSGLKNECEIDGVIYTFTPNYTITLSGNVVNKNIKFFYSEYAENYENYLDATIKGDLYKEYSVLIEQKE